MTRPAKRQEKRAQEQELKMKELKVKGFNFVGAEEYHKKRAIANRKRGYETPEDEKSDRQLSVESALKVYQRTLPILLNRLSKINDPRQPKKLKHSLTVLHDLWNADVCLPTAIFKER